MRRGQRDQAAFHFHQVLRVDPNNADAAKALGELDPNQPGA